MKPLKIESKGVKFQTRHVNWSFQRVIVHKKDGGNRMAIDYREVNMQLEST